MKQKIIAVAMLVALAGCGGGSGNGSNPITGGSGGSGSGGGSGGGSGLTENTIPAKLAGDLSRISYDPVTQTLTVEMFALDNNPLIATYTLNTAAEFAVPGYTAFTTQDDPLDRMFVALVAASPDGSVKAGVVADGGQFTSYFKGGYYQRTGTYTQPSTGLVSYAGSYAGIANENGAGNNLLPPPAGTPAVLLPGEPRATQGTAFLNVDFDNNAVNGAIYDRTFTDNGETLADIVLSVTSIDSNGEFLGTAKFDNHPELGTNGDYGGTLAGVDASSMAGIVSLDTIYLPTDSRDTPFDAEVGVFVLPQCGTAGSPAICNGVNPLGN